MRTFEFWTWELLPRNEGGLLKHSYSEQARPRQYRNPVHLELVGLGSGHSEAERTASDMVVDHQH